MIPVYGFLQGDTVGILLLLDEQDTMGEVRRKLERSAQVRVAPSPGGVVYHDGRSLEDNATVAQVGIQALDRVEVKWVTSA